MGIGIRGKLAAASALVVALAACGGSSDGGGDTVTGNPSVTYRSATVAPGAQCPTGGVQLDVGIDENLNGVLDAAEIDATEYVCNGLGLAVAVSPEGAGGNCSNGGLKVDTGGDADADGDLDPAEIALTRYLCNGGAGAPSLVRSTMVPPGNEACAVGGYLLESGIDDDGDGILDAAEIDPASRAYVCSGRNGTDGTDGIDGTDGLTSLVRVIPVPVGADCDNGGVAVQSGDDNNGNGVLDAPAEVAVTEYICNGAGATPPESITTLPLVIPASLNAVAVKATIDTGDRRLPDGTRADFYAFTLTSDGVIDLSAIPAGAVEFHLFTSACLASADLEDWSPCFLGEAPRQRVAAGSYVVMVKATSTSWLWGTTPYEAIVRFSPGTVVGALTIAEHITEGVDAIKRGADTAATDDFLAGIEHFEKAADLIPTDASATPADKERARFFGAVAHVASLLRPYSDLVPDNGLSDLGDILDGFGLGGTEFQRSDLEAFPKSVTVQTTSQSCDMYGCWTQTQEDLAPLSPDSPRSQELQAFLRDAVAAELQQAIALLDAAGAGFAYDLVDGADTVQFDYTDVLVARAAARGMLAFIRIQEAYDLDTDLDDLRTNVELEDRDGRALYGPDAFKDENPFFLRLRSAATLPTARSTAIAAIQDYRAALAALGAETDDQADDLFVLTRETCGWDPTLTFWSCTTVYNPADLIARYDRNVGEAQAALQATGNYPLTFFDTDVENDIVVNPNAFFAGVDLRSKAPATFEAGPQGDRIGFFPDPTFGGVLVSSTIDWTTDLDGDGSPDWFNNDYSSLFPGYLGGHQFSSPWGDYTCGFTTFPTCQNVYGTYYMAVNGTFTYVVTSPTPGSYTGTWSAVGKELTLIYDVAGPLDLKTTVISSERIQEGFLDGQVQTWTNGGYYNGNWIYWNRI